MAAIANDRDVLLQAASVRVIPIYVEAAGISITANTTTITGPTSGASTPASIILTAKLLGGLTGTVFWSKTGTGTLTPSGNTATITGSTMDFNPVVVTASIVAGGKTYSSQINLIKIKDQTEIQGEINNLMNSSKDFTIRTDGTTVAGASGTTTTPASIKLEAVKKNGLTGTVTWSVLVSGSATVSPSTGDTTYVSGSSITGTGATIKASITSNGKTYEAFATVNRLGAIAASDKVNLATQITGQLANGNVSGLKALALLDAVSLSPGSTTVVGDLAASRIGAGTLGAGVIYAGTINAEKINGGSFSGQTFTGGEFIGATFRTNPVGGSQSRLDILQGPMSPEIVMYDGYGSAVTTISLLGTIFRPYGLSTTPALQCVGSAAAPAIYIDGRLSWGPYSYTAPPGDSTKFLCANGTWATPSGGGSSGVTSFNTRTGAVSLTYNDVNTAVNGQTLGVNVTGTSGDSSKLGGHAANQYLRVAGSTVGGTRPFVAYLPVSAAGSTYYIPLYS